MWHKVAKTGEVGKGQGKVVEAGGQQVALFNVDGQFYAIDNLCHHQGGPLGEGYLDDCIVTCPWHAWTYDVKTGECQSVPDLKQTCYPVKVEGEDVFVDA